MSPEAPAVVRNFPVGSRICTMTIPHPRPGGTVTMTTEWWPDVPQQLNRHEWRQYRAGRNKAIADLSAKTGKTAAVIDVG